MKARATFLVGALCLAVCSWAGIVSAAPAPVTQGQLAGELGKRLGVCDGGPACVEALRALGIEPPGGWQPGKPVSAVDLADLTDDVILAAKEGKIPFTPQRAVDLLAAACIDLGLMTWDVYVTAYGALGYYFPPQIPPGAGSGGWALRPGETEGRRQPLLTAGVSEAADAL
ncbi:MAG: hypothetical protein ACUVXD_07630 [Thermodesulfobacteriota bacterium]